MTIIHTTTSKFDYERVEASTWELTPLDVANALAKINRFGGHTTDLWSVGQHSLLTYVLAKPGYKRAALLHDAAEVVVGDVVSPLKVALNSDNLRRFDSAITAILWSRWGNRYLDEDVLAEVHRVDVLALHTEASMLVPNYDARNRDEWPPCISGHRLDAFGLVLGLTPDWRSTRDLFLAVFHGEPTELDDVPF